MIDLRSDTVTKPTEKMRKAACDAPVGDDVYGEDPSVIKLEEKAAEILGKEAALFVTSGTQGNQIAVLTHCRPGTEVIIEADAHIFYYEGAAISAFAGVQPRTIKGTKGALNADDVRLAIRPDDIHFPETSLICIENTHNRAGGAILSLNDMKSVYDVAVSNQVPLHLDGARLFNACAASGISAEAYAAQTDTVQICLSKGLGAPVGSIIAGPTDFIKRARKWRKRLGGGLRQAGIIAEPGYIALTEMRERLQDDHHHAMMLKEAFQGMDGLVVENDVDTNILILNVEKSGYNALNFLEEMKASGVAANAVGPNAIRLTTHYDVSRKDIMQTIEIIWGIVKKNK